MSSLKCPHCGLVNFSSAEVCKRCGNRLSSSADILKAGARRGITLISCPACSAEVSNQASSCPKCGQPIKVAAPRTFKGPPDECLHCGGPLKKGSRQTSEGFGCALFIGGLFVVPLLSYLVGILLLGVIIGLIMVVAGVIKMWQTERFWECQKCGAKLPRKVA
jgi:ribosomal protein L40E